MGNTITFTITIDKEYIKDLAEADDIELTDEQLQDFFDCLESNDLCSQAWGAIEDNLRVDLRDYEENYK